MAVVNSDSFRSLSIDQQLDIILADGTLLAGQTSDRVEQESLLDSRSTADPSFDPLLKQTVIQAIELSRSAQAAWSQQPVSSRLKVIRELRLEIARNPRAWALAVGRDNLGETLAAEVLPLADACRFLEVRAAAVLRDRKVDRRGRPTWLWGTNVRLRREPFGVVLIVGPSNYPLMLPGIQAMQALAAGNGVLLKPGAGGTAAANLLRKVAVSKGLPPEVLQILPESPQAGSIAIQNGIDKIILTGSVAAGRSVSRDAAERGIPTVMELSGCDAVFALDDADPELVSDCILFGLTLNHSHTCIAPRRIFATETMASAIIARLVKKLPPRSFTIPTEGEPSVQIESVGTRERIGRLISVATSAGARLRTDAIEVVDGRPRLNGIAVLDEVKPEMEIVRVDPYAPVVSFLRVRDETQALAWYRKCPFALGASVFGSRQKCQRFANQIDAGIVVINDLIAPTADPRVPFGGRHQSGFGMTRGVAGLEEMTQLKTIVSSRNWFRPHLKTPTPADAGVLEQLIRLEHAPDPLTKLKSIPGMLASTLAQIQFRKAQRKNKRLS